MIYYFKYDSGNAFTLNGSPYTGFFYVSAGNAYTGKFPSSNQSKLSSRGTFMADFYINQLEFDRSFNNIPNLEYNTPNTFDVLDINTLRNYFDILNINNLEVFKNLVVQNPKVFNVNQTNTHFYGLSSTDADSRNDDIPNAKNVYTHIDPFSFDSEWSFVDSIIAGDFLLDSRDNFLYFCSDGTNQYTLRGSFTEFGTLELINSRPSPIFYIKQDDVDKKIFMMGPDKIEIYDSTYFNLCQNLNLIDTISITIDPEDAELFKIGKNIRTEYVNGSLLIKNKYSTEVISTLNVDSLSADRLIALDLRESDDAMVLLFEKSGEFYTSLIDLNPFSIGNTEKLSDASNPRNVIFSIQDSNLFYLITDNDVQLRMFSNMEFPVGSSRNADYFYLNDYIYGTTDERFGQIQIKYNSNALPSNSFNNILFRIRLKNRFQYLMTHNIGRLYVSKLGIDNNLLNSIPLDTEKSYDGITCSTSSIGLYFNSSVIDIVKDILKLYTLSKYKLVYDGEDLVYGPISDLEFEIKNLYIHGNETVSVISLQRIFYLITDIQRQLISTP